MKTAETSSATPIALAQTIADRYAAIAEVEAVALGGSRTSDFADERSDVDLYIYVSAMPTLEQRANAATGARKAEIGNSFWEPGDEWIDADSGISVDVMFRTTPWIEELLDRVLRRHEPSMGYSTCFWYNLRNSRPLFDRVGWFSAIQQKSQQPYPKELKRAIIAKNYLILRKNQSSYLHQIELAIRRHDAVSVNHRVTALLASYFDIVFAVNEQPHPGEKRLVKFAQALCAKLPPLMEEDVNGVLTVVSSDKLRKITALLDGLDELLRQEDLVPGKALQTS